MLRVCQERCISTTPTQLTQPLISCPRQSQTEQHRGRALLAGHPAPTGPCAPRKPKGALCTAYTAPAGQQGGLCAPPQAPESAMRAPVQDARLWPVLLHLIQLPPVHAPLAAAPKRAFWPLPKPTPAPEQAG